MPRRHVVFRSLHARSLPADRDAIGSAVVAQIIVINTKEQAPGLRRSRLDLLARAGIEDSGILAGGIADFPDQSPNARTLGGYLAMEAFALQSPSGPVGLWRSMYLPFGNNLERCTGFRVYACSSMPDSRNSKNLLAD